MSTFIRESFYIPPPKPGASVEVWQAWLKADRQEAINAKRRHTMSLKAEPENIKLWSHGSGIPIAGKDGVHRQSVGFIGFESAGEESTQVVAAVAATQDRHFQARGGRSRPNAEVLNITRRRKGRVERAARFKK